MKCFTLQIQVFLMTCYILNITDAVFASSKLEQRLLRGKNIFPSGATLWPQPQFYNLTSQDFMVLRESEFFFTAVKETCSIMEEAFKRHFDLIFRTGYFRKSSHLSIALKKAMKHEKFSGFLKKLIVYLESPCEYSPDIDMDESYDVRLFDVFANGTAVLSAPSIWGILRGLQTFTQLVYYDTETGYPYRIDSVIVVDFPRFPHRGILLDTSRHFLPVATILEQLDLMAYHKFNVLHWHMTDDESFPYRSRRYANLSEFGAYHPITHVYSSFDVQRIISYGRKLGIRIMPEFDMPGHSASWGKGYPNLLAECYFHNKPTGIFGPMNPAAKSTYEFIQGLLLELCFAFEDTFIHIGGDEVNYTCWLSNPEVLNFILNVLNSSKPQDAQTYFINEVIKLIQFLPLKRTPIVWQEVFDGGKEFHPNTIIHIWKSENYKNELKLVTAAGYRAILSSCWYLDKIRYGVDWYLFYQCDPHPEELTPNQRSLVIGGEACIWGEYVDRTNLMTRLWPRASAVAERLWSAKDVTSVRFASERLHNHRCRLVKWGYSVAPANGPGYCPVEM